MHRFTCGEKKSWWNIKKSQNIIKAIVGKCGNRMRVVTLKMEYLKSMNLSCIYFCIKNNLMAKVIAKHNIDVTRIEIKDITYGNIHFTVWSQHLILLLWFEFFNLKTNLNYVVRNLTEKFLLSKIWPFPLQLRLCNRIQKARNLLIQTEPVYIWSIKVHVILL